MMEWIISSSVLILGVVLLRRVLRGKLSLRLQYALWLVVLVRLLCPVSFFQSGLSVQNVPAQVRQQIVTPVVQEQEAPVKETPQRQQMETPAENIPVQNEAVQNEAPTVSAGEKNAEQVVEIEPTMEERLEALSGLAIRVWSAGMAVAALFVAASNLLFARKLRKNRTPIEIPGCPVPVYVSGEARTPCLVGLFRPVVYFTSEVAEDESTWTHVMEHELTHLRHCDPLFGALRCAALVLHWYNPLVWMAAKLSKADGELACDEGTIARLGEGERIPYGETLIRLTCKARGPAELMLTATTMTDSPGSIRQRIRLIAKRPKTAAYAIVIGIIAVGLMVGCTFTGAVEETEPTETTQLIETTEPEPTEELDWYQTYMADKGFEYLGGASANEYLYTGDSREVAFDEIGLTLTVPEAWADQVEVVWSGYLDASDYNVYIVNRRLAEYHGKISRDSYAVRIWAVRKNRTTELDPRTDWEKSEYSSARKYLGENNEFYFYVITAEMSWGMDSPMFCKELIVKEKGQDYYDDLVGDLIADPEEVPGWLTIWETPAEYVQVKPVQNLEENPDFEWTGLAEVYRYCGSDGVISFPELGFTLTLPKQWLSHVEVIYKADTEGNFGLYVMNKDILDRIPDSWGQHPYLNPMYLEYILRIFADDEVSGACWVLDDSGSQLLMAETREMAFLGENDEIIAPLVYGRNSMIQVLGEDRYYDLANDYVADQSMITLDSGEQMKLCIRREQVSEYQGSEQVKVLLYNLGSSEMKLDPEQINCFPSLERLIITLDDRSLYNGNDRAVYWNFNELTVPKEIIEVPARYQYALNQAASEETTLPSETTEQVVVHNDAWYQSLMESRDFAILDNLWENEYLYTGDSRELFFEEIGLTVTIPEEWADQVEVIWAGSLDAQEYSFYLVNRRLAEEYHGKITHMAFAVRISAVRKMYSMAADPVGVRSYVGENNEFYFYVTTAEMTGGMDTPMFWKQFIVQERGQEYYDDLIGDLIADPEEVPGWLTIRDVAEEFVEKKPAQNLEWQPEFEWIGIWNIYRYEGESDTIDFSRYGFTLTLPEGWKDRVEVIISDSYYSVGIYVLNRDVSQAFIDNQIRNPYFELAQSDFIFAIEGSGSAVGDCWVLGRGFFAVTREQQLSDESRGLRFGKAQLIEVIGEEKYNELIGDLVVDEALLREMITLTNGEELTYFDMR